MDFSQHILSIHVIISKFSIFGKISKKPRSNNSTVQITLNAKCSVFYLLLIHSYYFGLNLNISIFFFDFRKWLRRILLDPAHEPQPYGCNSYSSKDSIIQELRISLSLEQQNNEELVEILKVLQAEKHKLKEQRDHLQADVQRFAFYYEKDRENEVTKEKLVTSKADVTELAGLHDQILEKLVSLKANMTQH